MTDAVPTTTDAPPRSAPPRRTAAERQLGTTLAKSYKVWAALAISDLVRRLQLDDQRELTPEEQAALILLLLPRIGSWREQWLASADTSTAREAVTSRISQITVSARQQAHRAIERTGIAPNQADPDTISAISLGVSKMASDSLISRQQALVGVIAAIAQKSVIGGNLDGLQAQMRESAAKGARRARSSARELVGDLNGAVRKAEALANGVTHFVWRTKGDDRVRDSHEAKEGRIYTYAEGSDEGMPGVDPPGCRCWDEPVRV